MEFLLDPTILVSLATLTILEIILGIDNIIFIVVLTNKLPIEKRAFARRLGIAMAVISRLALLASIAWIASLTKPVFAFQGLDISWRDIILVVGGVFLIYKATQEIHDSIEGIEHEASPNFASASLMSIGFQIMLLDIIFSLDSVITAIGLAEHLWVMVVAVLIATGTMLIASGPLSRFIENHPTFKMLAFSFLLLIGVVLVADGLQFHVSKGYIYAAIAFSLLVEFFNMATRRKKTKNNETGA